MAITWQNWLEGDVYIEASAPDEHKAAWRALRMDLARAARRRFYRTGIKRKFYIESGYRSRVEQERLYQAYLNGGNLAAKPGYSNHEKGKAADVYVAGKPAGATKATRRALLRFGLCLPVPGEAWHVEHGAVWNA